MAGEYMLDDREAETGPALLPAAPLVDPEEALGQPGDEFRVDAFTGIGDDQVRTVRIGTPRQHDFAVARCESNGIRQQVDNHGLEFGRAALQACRRFNPYIDPRDIRMPLESLTDLLEQMTDVDRLLAFSLVGTLEP